MRQRRPRKIGKLQSRLSPFHPGQLERSGVRLITLGLVAISLWVLMNFVGQVIKSAQMERRKEEIQTEIGQIEATNVALKDQVAYAESQEYAERIAREQLGYAREGDTVILPTFPESTTVPLEPSPIPLPSLTPEPNWRGWMRALFPPGESP